MVLMNDAVLPAIPVEAPAVVASQEPGFPFRLKVDTAVAQGAEPPLAVQNLHVQISDIRSIRQKSRRRGVQRQPQLQARVSE